MKEETSEYPLVPLIWGVSTALTCAVFSIGFLLLSQYMPLTSVFTVLTFFFSLGMGYVVYSIAKRNEQYREDLDGFEYKLSELEVARESVKHDCERADDLFNSVSRCVSGILFRYEVPGFKEHGQFRFIGDAVAAVTGHSAQAVLDQPKLFLDSIHADDLEGFYASAKKASEANVKWEYPFRMVTSDGATKWFQINASPNDSRERPFCFDGVFFDVTPEHTPETEPSEPLELANELNAKLQSEVSRANAMMLKAEKTKSDNEDLIRNFSHEVRTTINGVQGMLEMLLEKNLDQEQYDCAIEARNTVRSLLPVIGDLIDHTYIRAGELSLENAPFNPKSLLRETVGMFEVEAKRTNIKLETVFDEQIPKLLEGDAARVRQVLFSLLNNAMHYTRTGTITTEFFCSGRAGKYTFVRIHVRDTGRGMSRKVKEKFFKNSVALNHEKGKSLGLPLCRNLVELMGGKLSVKSEEGSGSDVYFVLRLKDVSESYMEASSAPVDVECFQPLQILAAEDVLVNQKICKYRVESLGHKITIVDNGQKALEALANDAFDAVLMDCEMPIMDGFEATAAIRNHDHPVKNPGIYIVAVTAKALRGDRGSILESGMNEYLSKPFSQEDIEGAMNRITSYNEENGIGFVLPKQTVVAGGKRDVSVNVSTKASVDGRSGRHEASAGLGSRINKQEAEALMSLMSGKSSKANSKEK